jgi:hypothetical protein
MAANRCHGKQTRACAKQKAKNYETAFEEETLKAPLSSRARRVRLLSHTTPHHMYPWNQCTDDPVDSHKAAISSLSTNAAIGTI